MLKLIRTKWVKSIPQWFTTELPVHFFCAPKQPATVSPTFAGGETAPGTVTCCHLHRDQWRGKGRAEKSDRDEQNLGKHLVENIRRRSMEMSVQSFLMIINQKFMILFKTCDRFQLAFYDFANKLPLASNQSRSHQNPMSYRSNTAASNPSIFFIRNRFNQPFG